MSGYDFLFEDEAAPSAPQESGYDFLFEDENYQAPSYWSEPPARAAPPEVEEPEPILSPEDEDDWAMTRGWKAGWENEKALFNNVRALYNDYTGDTEERDRVLGYAAENEQRAQALSEGLATTWEDIEGLGSFLEWAGYTLGSLGPFAASSVVGGGVGGAAAKIGAKQLAKRAGKELTKEAAKKAGRRGALAGQVGVNYPVAVGDVYGNLIEEMGGDADAVDNEIALIAGVPYAALDIVAERIALGRFKGMLGSMGSDEASLLMQKFVRKSPKMWKRVGKNMIVQGLTEGLTEAGQEVVNLVAQEIQNPDNTKEEREWLSRLKNAFAAGALGGATIGGISGIRNPNKKPIEPTDPTQTADPTDPTEPTGDQTDVNTRGVADDSVAAAIVGPPAPAGTQGALPGMGPAVAPGAYKGFVNEGAPTPMQQYKAQKEAEDDFRSRQGNLQLTPPAPPSRATPLPEGYTGEQQMALPMDFGAAEAAALEHDKRRTMQRPDQQPAPPTELPATTEQTTTVYDRAGNPQQVTAAVPRETGMVSPYAAATETAKAGEIPEHASMAPRKATPAHMTRRPASDTLRPNKELFEKEQEQMPGNRRGLTGYEGVTFRGAHPRDLRDKYGRIDQYGLQDTPREVSGRTVMPAQEAEQWRSDSRKAVDDTIYLNLRDALDANALPQSLPLKGEQGIDQFVEEFIPLLAAGSYKGKPKTPYEVGSWAAPLLRKENIPAVKKIVDDAIAIMPDVSPMKAQPGEQLEMFGSERKQGETKKRAERIGAKRKEQREKVEQKTFKKKLEEKQKARKQQEEREKELRARAKAEGKTVEQFRRDKTKAKPVRLSMDDVVRRTLSSLGRLPKNLALSASLMELMAGGYNAHNRATVANKMTRFLTEATLLMTELAKADPSLLEDRNALNRARKAFAEVNSLATMRELDADIEEAAHEAGFTEDITVEKDIGGGETMQVKVGELQKPLMGIFATGKLVATDYTPATRKVTTAIVELVGALDSIKKVSPDAAKYLQDAAASRAAEREQVLTANKNLRPEMDIKSRITASTRAADLIEKAGISGTVDILQAKGQTEAAAEFLANEQRQRDKQGAFKSDAQVKREAEKIEAEMREALETFASGIVHPSAKGVESMRIVTQQEKLRKQMLPKLERMLSRFISNGMPPADAEAQLYTLIQRSAERQARELELRKELKRNKKATLAAQAKALREAPATWADDMDELARIEQTELEARKEAMAEFLKEERRFLEGRGRSATETEKETSRGETSAETAEAKPIKAGERSPGDAGRTGAGGAKRGRGGYGVAFEPKQKPVSYVPVRGYRNGLSEAQTTGVNHVLTHFFNRNGETFLLADGPGFGKTRQALVVAAEYAKKHPDKKILIITPRSEITKQWGAEAKKLGIDTSKLNIAYGTYANLLRNKHEGKHGLVIFDEAHAVRSPEAQRTIRAHNIDREKTLFITATKVEKAEHLTLAQILWPHLNLTAMEKKWFSEMGLVRVKKKVQPKSGFTTEDVHANLERLARQLVDSGALLERNLNPRTKFRTQSLGWQDLDQNVFVGGAEDLVSLDRMFGSMENVGTGLNNSSLVAESAKHKAVVSEIKKAISSGQKPIVFFSAGNSNNPRKDYFVTTEVKDENGQNKRYQLHTAMKLVSDALKQEGISFVEIYGKGDKSKQQDAFQNGTVDVALVTYDKAKEGLNLDDQKGDAPRLSIHVQPPWEGTSLVQALGRADRAGTKSDPEALLMFGPMRGDTHRANIVTQKLENHLATAGGNSDKLDLIRGAVDKAVEEAPADTKVNPYGLAMTGPDTAIFKVNNIPASVYQKKIKPLISAAGKRVHKGEGRVLNIVGTSEERIESLREQIDAALSKPANLRRTTRAASKADMYLTAYLRPLMQSGATPDVDSILKLIAMNDKGLYGDWARFLLTKDLGVSDIVLNNVFAGQEVGQFIPGTRDILLNLDKDAYPTHTILHEISHAAEHHVVETNPVLRRKLQTLLDQVRAAADTAPYGLTDVHEFLVEGNMNPYFVEFLKQTEVGNTTAWTRFKNWVKQALASIGLRVKPSRPHRSAFDALMEISKDAFQSYDPKLHGALTEAFGLETAQAADAALPFIEGAAQAVTRAKPYAGQVADTLRERVMLPFMTFRQIVESFSDRFKSKLTLSDDSVVEVDPMRDLNNLTHEKTVSMRKAQREGELKYYRPFADLQRESVKEADKLANVVIEASAAQIHPDVGFDDAKNAHLWKLTKRQKDKNVDVKTTAAYKAAVMKHAALKAEYDKLKPETQKIYADMQEYVSKQWHKRIGFLYKTFVRKLLPHDILLTDPARDKLVDELADQTAVYDANGNLTGFNAEALKKHIVELNPNLERLKPEQLDKRLEPFTDAVSRLVDAAQLDGPYIPFRRHGKYVTTARTNTKTVTEDDDGNKFTSEEQVRDFKKAMKRANPWIRFGDTNKFAIYKDDEGNKVESFEYEITYFEQEVQFHNTLAAAQKRYEELRSDDKWTKVPEPMTKDQLYNSESLPGNVFQVVENNAKLSEAERYRIRAALIEMLPDTSIHQARLRRSTVAGVKADELAQTMAEHVKASAHHDAQLEFGPRIGEKISIMQKVMEGARTTGGRDQRIMNSVFQEITKRDTLDSKPVDDRAFGQLLSGTLSNVGFAWYLASISYWIVNATQPVMVTLPWLSARFNPATAALEMKNAYALMTPDVIKRMKSAGGGFGFFKGARVPEELFEFLGEGGSLTEGFAKRINKSDSLSSTEKAELISMLESLGNTGLIDLTFAADLEAAAKGSWQSTQAIMEWVRIMPHLVEMLNRTATATAAYQLARKDGQSVEQARKFAEEAVAATQFDYSAMNKPRYFSERFNPLVRPVTMFMQHTQHMYYLLIRAAAQSFGVPLKKLTKGEKLTKAEQKNAMEARRTLLGIFTTHALVSGVSGALFEPLKYAIAAVLGLFRGEDEEPVDMREEVRAFFTQLTGSELLGTGIAEGPLYASGIGPDITGRINVSNLLLFPQYSNDSGREWLESKVFDMTGPLGSIFANFAEGLKNLSEGDHYRGFQQMVPKAVRDVLRAYQFSQKGITDTGGASVWGSDKFNPGQIVSQAVGLGSSEASEVYTRQRAYRRRDDYWTGKKSRLVERFRRADTPKERSDVWKEILIHNNNVPARAFRITRGDTLRRSINEMRRRERTMRRNEGVNVSRTKRELYKDIDFILSE